MYPTSVRFMVVAMGLWAACQPELSDPEVVFVSPEVLVGTSLQGTYEASPYATQPDAFCEYYDPSGRVSGFDAFGAFDAPWEIRGLEMCVTFDNDDSATCFAVSVAGSEVGLYFDDPVVPTFVATQSEGNRCLGGP